MVFAQSQAKDVWTSSPGDFARGVVTGCCVIKKKKKKNFRVEFINHCLRCCQRRPTLPNLQLSGRVRSHQILLLLLFFFFILLILFGYSPPPRLTALFFALNLNERLPFDGGCYSPQVWWWTGAQLRHSGSANNSPASWLCLRSPAVKRGGGKKLDEAPVWYKGSELKKNKNKEQSSDGKETLVIRVAKPSPSRHWKIGAMQNTFFSVCSQNNK